MSLAPGTVQVAWAPDGTRIVYQTVTHGDPMFVADANGANPRQIFVGPSGRHNHYQTWSLDGQWIYFVSYQGNANEMDLWRIAASGGMPERLPRTAARWLVPRLLTAARSCTWPGTMMVQDRGCGPSMWDGSERVG